MQIMLNVCITSDVAAIIIQSSKSYYVKEELPSSIKTRASIYSANIYRTAHNKNISEPTGKFYPLAKTGQAR
jgi:hypothetical protein